MEVDLTEMVALAEPHSLLLEAEDLGSLGVVVVGRLALGFIRVLGDREQHLQSLGHPKHMAVAAADQVMVILVPVKVAVEMEVDLVLRLHLEQQIEVAAAAPLERKILTLLDLAVLGWLYFQYPLLDIPEQGLAL
jgi:hypothetical protein